MKIETKRLIIRSVERGDEKVFCQMAKDGSLTEVGFDKDCGEWIGDWINEALELTANDDPRADYIPCTIVDRRSDQIIGNVGCTYYEDMKKVGICYFVGSAYRRKGYTTEAAKAYAGDKHTAAAAISDNTNFLLFTYTTPSWKRERCQRQELCP